MNNTAASSTPLFKFPGYGLCLDFNPADDTDSDTDSDSKQQKGRRKLFLTALDDDIAEPEGDARMPIITKRETAMLAFINQVTDKADWVHKIKESSITEKWKQEIKRQDEDFTDKMFKFCLDELKDKAEKYATTGAINLFHGDVVKSDLAIPQHLKDALKAAVAPLENVPDDEKDWHPGSNEIVLDLVHPSLNPLVYGRSRIISSEKLNLATGISMCGGGEIVPVLDEEEAGPKFGVSWFSAYHDVQSYSKKFQWLPCDVDTSGDTPMITSYINNLHPQKYPQLYIILEEIIDRVIPMWNLTLTPLRNFAHEHEFPTRITLHDIDYGDMIDFLKKEVLEKGDDLNDDERWDRTWEWKKQNKPRFLVRPEPDDFSPPSFNDPVDLKTDYDGLQIIVKLANIHLTPEKPEYQGGSWHVEGKMNEHICASAIYYCDNENITESRLAFRQATSPREAEEQSYEQDDHAWLEEIYGMDRSSPAVQDVGSVETREGRVITFPNILQHQVQPFKLQDPTKPGHRKILALFLVDPGIKIISTGHIPWQQKESWADEVFEGNNSSLSRLPPELQDLVLANLKDFLISEGEAKELRNDLMEERKKYELGSNNHFESVTISLCEH